MKQRQIEKTVGLGMESKSKQNRCKLKQREYTDILSQGSSALNPLTLSPAVYFPGSRMQLVDVSVGPKIFEQDNNRDCISRCEKGQGELVNMAVTRYNVEPVFGVCNVSVKHCINASFCEGEQKAQEGQNPTTPSSSLSTGSDHEFLDMTGLCLWPVSFLVVEWLLSISNLHMKSVLDLGAGCGICSLVAARLGATVTATDGNTDAVELIRENRQLNAILDTQLTCEVLRWGHNPGVSNRARQTHEILTPRKGVSKLHGQYGIPRGLKIASSGNCERNSQFDVLIACDVGYLSSSVIEELFQTVLCHLRRDSSAVFVVGYVVRGPSNLPGTGGRALIDCGARYNLVANLLKIPHLDSDKQSPFHRY